jgi:hypothetical protein
MSAHGIEATHSLRQASDRHHSDLLRLERRRHGQTSVVVGFFNDAQRHRRIVDVPGTTITIPRFRWCNRSSDTISVGRRNAWWISLAA